MFFFHDFCVLNDLLFRDSKFVLNNEFIFLIVGSVGPTLYWLMLYEFIDDIISQQAEPCVIPMCLSEPTRDCSNELKGLTPMHNSTSSKSIRIITTEVECTTGRAFAWTFYLHHLCIYMAV